MKCQMKASYSDVTPKKFPSLLLDNSTILQLIWFEERTPEWQYVFLLMMIAEKTRCFVTLYKTVSENEKIAPDQKDFV